MTETDIDKSHLNAAKAEFRKAVIGSLSGIELMSAVAKYLYADPFEHIRINRLKQDFPGLPEKLVGKACNEHVPPVECVDKNCAVDEPNLSLWTGV